MTRPTVRAISASQIKNFRACPRKWGWDKLVGADRGPGSPATILGSRVHEILEDWLENGTPPDPAEAYTYVHPRSPTETITALPGKIAQAGLHLLPAPKTGHVEGELHLKTKAGPYYGRIDLHGLDADGVPYVLDHKTTSGAGFRYALTPETLVQDVQALLYAAWAMVHYKAQEVRLRWIYYLTRGTPRARAVEATVTRAQIADALAEIDQTAAIMWEAYRRRLHAIDLPPRVAACRDYGGCEYAQLCNLSPAQVLEATMSETRNPQTLDDLLAGMGLTPPAPSVPGAPPPAPSPPAPPPAPSPPAPPPAPPATTAAIRRVAAKWPETSQVTPQANINPPEAPAPDKEPPTPRAEKPPAAPVSRPAKDAGRKEVKAYAVQIGAVDSSSRLGLPKLWEAIVAAETGTPDRHDEIPPPPPVDGVPDVEVPAVPRAPTIPIEGGALDRADTVADYPNPIQVAGRRLADLWTAESPEDAAKVEAVMDLVVAFLGEVARRG